jgi:hypothetical protein
VAYQLLWAVLLATKGLLLCAAGASFLAVCVVYVAYYYGDHAGRVCGVLTKPSAHRHGRGHAGVHAPSCPTCARLRVAWSRSMAR